MPEAAYESMRDEFAPKIGMKAVKKKAAMIFNSRRKPGEDPVTRYRETFARGARKRAY